MKNEYGAQLDSNGYAPSLDAASGNHCHICFKLGDKVRHEAFHGPFRSKSKKYGLWVNLCPECHWMVHNGDNGLDLEIKENMQFAAMRHYGWSTEEFIQRFGKNYL